MSLDGGTEQIDWALKVVADSPICGSREFHVLMILLRHRNRGSGLSWPSAGTISKRADAAAKTRDMGKRGLERLIEAGIIYAAASAKGEKDKSTVKYGFNIQPGAEVRQSQVEAEVHQPEITTPQVGADVLQPNVQVEADVHQAEVEADVHQPEPGWGISAPQVGAELPHKPLLEPQIQLPPPTTTSPVEEWTEPTEANLAWLAGQVSTKVEGCVIELDSITEKMMKARNPVMTEAAWRNAALALLTYWQSKADAASTFTATAVAGDERPRVRDGEWKPSKAAYQEMLPEFPLISDSGVIHEITRVCIDHYAKQEKAMTDLKSPDGAWKTFVRNNYEEAIRGHRSLRNPQMTGTE